MTDTKPTNLVPPAQYFNVMRVSHTPREFYFDLGQLIDETSGVASLIARAVTTPAHAKAVLKVLGESIRKYESRFGTIPDPRPNPEALQ